MAEPNWNALYSNQGVRLSGNPALDELKSGFAAERKQKALDNKSYADQIAKLNFGGAKDADLPYLHKQYGTILNTFGELRNTNDPVKRAALQQQLSQSQNKFLFDIEHSKQNNKQDLEGSHAILMSPDEKLKEGARDRWVQVNGTSSFDPTYEQVKLEAAKNTWADKPVDVVGETQKLVKDNQGAFAMDDVQENMKNGAFRIVGEKGVRTNVEKLTNDITRKATQDPHYLAGIQKATGIENPQEALKTFIGATVADAKKADYTAKDIGSLQNKPDTFYAHLAARLASGDGGGGVGTPRDLTYPYAGGKGIVTMKGAVPLTSAVLNLGGSPSYNMTTGELDPQVLSSGDHQIVTIANVPIITNGTYNGKSLKGTIAQPNFYNKYPKAVQWKPMLQVQTKDQYSGEAEDHLVDVDRLPANLPKALKTALSGFKPYAQPKGQVAQPTKASVVKGTNKRLW